MFSSKKVQINVTVFKIFALNKTFFYFFCSAVIIPSFVSGRLKQAKKLFYQSEMHSEKAGKWVGNA